MKSSKREAWRQLLCFRCTGCTACCTDTIVPVTDQDVRRIMRATGQGAQQIVRFFGPDDVKGDRRSPGWIKLRQGKRFMGLRKSRGHCLYLHRRRCLIYRQRPVTCRLYPFNIFFDAKGQVETLEINDAVKCGHALDGRVSLEAIKALYFRDERQDEAYFARVKRWNAQRPNGTAKEFLAFLGLLKATGR